MVNSIMKCMYILLCGDISYRRESLDILWFILLSTSASGPQSPLGTTKKYTTNKQNPDFEGIKELPRVPEFEELISSLKNGGRLSEVNLTFSIAFFLKTPDDSQRLMFSLSRK